MRKNPTNTVYVRRGRKDGREMDRLKREVDAAFAAMPRPPITFSAMQRIDAECREALRKKRDKAARTTASLSNWKAKQRNDSHHDADNV